MAISRIEQSVGRIANDAIYGSGVDGTVVITTDTTLTSDSYYANLTVNSGVLLNTNGYRVFVKGTLTLNGYIGIGSVSGGTVGEPQSNISDKTVPGNTTSTIQYRIGGEGGGGTSPGVTLLPSFLVKDINVMSRGVLIDISGVINTAGGSKGTTGSTGSSTPAYTSPDSWPGKAGTAGSPGSATGSTGISNPYKDSAYPEPGGKGATGGSGTVTGATPGPGGDGGSGGSGGAVVCVVAKTIVGSGKFISLGRSGASGSAGTYGNPGTAGSTGSSGPNRSYHVAPTTHPTPDSRNYAHHGTVSIHSDRHGHKVAPHSDYKGHPFEGIHWHHGGHYHHPHNDGPHGGVHHWDGHYWHAWSPSSSFGHWSPHYPPHSHQKPNGHHTNHDAGGNASHHDVVYHGSFGGHDGHVHAHFGLPHHSHTHAHHPITTPRWHHHANPPGSSPNPDGHFSGGAGGAGGAAAPAVQGGTGKRGGAGGGGAILVITDSVAGTIEYDTRAGLTADSDNYSASSGTAYVLINA